MNQPTLRPLRPLLVLLGALAGCASQPSQLDREFGMAVHAVRMQQVLHPQPAQAANPVAGIDGKAGKSAFDAYQKSFQEPTPQTGALTIGVAR